MKQSEELFQFALEMDEQSKYERDPTLIAWCCAQRDSAMRDAAKLEKEGE